MATDRVRLVVVFGGQSAEHDVSCVSAAHVLRAVDPERYELDAIGIARDGTWVRAEEALAALAPARRALEAVAPTATGPVVEPLPTLRPAGDGPVVVFPLVHGTTGEDGVLQGLLELLDVPYVGTGVLGSALCMDKLKAKDVAAAHGIPQVPWVGLRREERPDAATLVAEAGLRYPCFVKPANCGSSVGVSKVDGLDDLGPALELAARYDEWLVIEEGAQGREIEVAVLGNEHPRASVPGEVAPAKEFYDYEDKYLDGAAELTIPADLPVGVADEVRALALRTFVALRCEGLARVDFFFEEHGRGLLLNEVNTLPGFTPISMYPKLWAASGLDYPALVDELVALAQARHRRRGGRSIER